MTINRQNDTLLLRGCAIASNRAQKTRGFGEECPDAVVQTQKKNEKFLPVFREICYYCRPNRLFLSMKTYLIAFAVFFAIAVRANVALPGLMPSASEFQWEGWDIKIVGLNFTDGIKTPFGEKGHRRTLSLSI